MVLVQKNKSLPILFCVLFCNLHCLQVQTSGKHPEEQWCSSTACAFCRRDGIAVAYFLVEFSQRFYCWYGSSLYARSEVVTEYFNNAGQRCMEFAILGTNGEVGCSAVGLEMRGKFKDGFKQSYWRFMAPSRSATGKHDAA